MRRYILLILIVIFSSGCFYFSSNCYDTITQQPSNEWDYREALTIISASMSHNLYDNRTNIKVMATPYYPSVILAIERVAQLINHWPEEKFHYNADILLHDNVGMYIEWNTNRFVDARGNYFKDKLSIDSLMFLVTIENKAWSTGNSGSIANGSFIPLISFDNIYIPDITNLEDRIFLINDKGEFIKPKYVWGKRNNMLTMPETMFAMFHFRNGAHHFLEGSEKMYLLIKGFETDIKLTFPLWMMR